MTANNKDVLIHELHPLKLFNLFSDKTRVDFLKSVYDKYIESNLNSDVLYKELNKYQLDAYKSQNGCKISTLALLAMDIDELTVYEINQNYDYIEDILLNADIFFESNQLTQINRYKFLNFLLNEFSKTEILNPFIEKLILEIIKLREPIHKNVLISLLKNQIDEITKNDIERYMNNLISKNLIKQMVTGYSTVNKELIIDESKESNYSIILNEIGNYLIDLDQLINGLISSNLNLPKNSNYLKRLIKTLGFKVEENFVLNPQYSNLNLAIEMWLKNYPGIIDKSNTEKLFVQNQKLKKMIDDFILLPYRVDKFINVRIFFEPNELKKLWEKIYEIIPDNKILTVKNFSELDVYKNKLRETTDFREDFFTDLFLESLIKSDRRIYSVKRLNHIFHKSRKISKLDLVYEIVNKSERISIQMLKLRLAKDYQVNHFSYDLIKKSKNRYKFYMDPQNHLYKSYDNYIQFMKRGQ